MAESFPPLHEITTGSFIVPFSPQRHRVTGQQSRTKLKSFAFSSRASRLRGESPAQDSPRSRDEREDFAKKSPFLPAKDFRVSCTGGSNSQEREADPYPGCYRFRLRTISWF